MVLLTNPWGDYVFVSHEELEQLTSGKLDESSALHAKLAERNFLRERVDLDALADRMSQKKRFLDAGAFQSWGSSPAAVSTTGGRG